MFIFIFWTGISNTKHRLGFRGISTEFSCLFSVLRTISRGFPLTTLPLLRYHWLTAALSYIGSQSDLELGTLLPQPLKQLVSPSTQLASYFCTRIRSGSSLYFRKQLSRRWVRWLMPMPVAPKRLALVTLLWAQWLHNKIPRQPRIPSEILSQKTKDTVWWWCTPLIPALGRQRQVDLCEFEVSLVYRVSFRTGLKATEKTYL